ENLQTLSPSLSHENGQGKGKKTGNGNWQGKLRGTALFCAQGIGEGFLCNFCGMRGSSFCFSFLPPLSLLPSPFASVFLPPVAGGCTCNSRVLGGGSVHCFASTCILRAGVVCLWD